MVNDLEKVATSVLHQCYNLHKELGIGLFENVYKLCLLESLRKIGIKAEAEVILPVTYKGITFEGGYRIDLLVEKSIIIELKAVNHLTDQHKMQLLTYLRLSGAPLGFLINFHQPYFKDGCLRIINPKRDKIKYPML